MKLLTLHHTAPYYNVITAVLLHPKGLDDAQTADAAIINVFTDIASSLTPGGANNNNASYTLVTTVTGTDDGSFVGTSAAIA